MHENAISGSWRPGFSCLLTEIRFALRNLAEDPKALVASFMLLRSCIAEIFCSYLLSLNVLAREVGIYFYRTIAHGASLLE